MIENRIAALSIRVPPILYIDGCCLLVRCVCARSQRLFPLRGDISERKDTHREKRNNQGCVCVCVCVNRKPSTHSRTEKQRQYTSMEREVARSFSRYRVCLLLLLLLCVGSIGAADRHCKERFGGFYFESQNRQKALGPLCSLLECALSIA